MIKTFLLIFLAAVLAAGSLAFCQAGTIEGLSPQAQEMERHLLQGLSPAQLQGVIQCVALFEGQPASSAGLQGALERVFSQAGIASMDVNGAAFLVLSMATKDMDDDIGVIMAEIKAMTQAKQKMRELIAELNRSIAAAMGRSAESPAVGNAGPALAQGASLNAEPLQTAHFKLGYWKVPPLAAMDVRSMPLERKMVELQALKIKLAELEDLQGRMSALITLGTRQRQEFVMELEGRAQKERIKPQR